MIKATALTLKNQDTQPDLTTVHTGSDSLAADYVPPWEGIEIPPGWQLTPNGLYREFEKGGQIQTELISGPIWVSAIAYGNQKDNWTAVIEFLDIDGHQHKLPCGRDRFYDRSNILVSDLAGFGLRIQPRQERQLLQYSIDCNPVARLLAVDRLGWLESDKLVYVRQDSTIGTLTEKDKTVSVIYKPERHVTIGQSIFGSLQDWQINVANQAYSEDMFIFALCVAFSPPLLKPAEMDSFGFNLGGGTTKGKTTALQISASVWGNGADPAAAPETSHAKRWNNTFNGLEGLAGEHNDGLMPFDELGTCPAKEFDYVIYNLFGGIGKGAMNAARQLKQQRRWRIVVLSTGEITVQEKLEQSGKKAKGGQLVRFPDIPFQLSEKITAKEIDNLKSACGQHYGTAGKKYLEYLVSNYADFRTLSIDIKDRLDIATSILKDAAGQTLSIEQVRCAKRFALPLVGGGLAKAAGILLCESQRIQDAVTATFKAYLKDSPGISDGERGILEIRDFILRHQSGRFIKIATDNTVDKSTHVNNLAGYIVQNTQGLEGLYLLFSGAFKEACGELGTRAVATALKENQLLRLDSIDARHQCRYTVDGQQQRFYAIKEEIITLDG